MHSSLFLYLAMALLAAGFTALALAARAWQNLETRPRLRRESIWIASAVIVSAVLSGISFWQYVALSRAEGEASRENIYDAFAAEPKIARLASVGLAPKFVNDDVVDLDGTTSLTVTLFPSGDFSKQFEPWQSTNRRRLADKLWLKMRITAPGFDVSPVLDETQQVPSDLMTFAWILRARQAGEQEVHVGAVAFRETPSGQIYERATVVNTMRAIEVRGPFPIESWTPIFTTLITVLLGGSLPFVLQALKSSKTDSFSSNG
jgi:hypothetical protein